MKSEIKGENFIKIKFRVVNVYKVTILSFLFVCSRKIKKKR